jgi:hypothetical protein
MRPLSTLQLALCFGVLTLVSDAALTAQQCPPDAAQAFLPVLPERAIERTLRDEVPDSAPASGLKANPDEFKTLLGYSGPYFNTDKLDGRVLVLVDSIAVGTGELWRATGMIRNQSCQTVRIRAVTARLLGPRGDPLDLVTATAPVDELRPGEPAPFVIEASVPRSAVSSVDWQVDYVPSAATASRTFKFEIYEAKPVLDGSRYSLFGSIHNEGVDTAAATHIVAAWLDDQGRVLYLAAPQLRRIADPKQLKSEMDLGSGNIEDFLYTTHDPSLVSLLGGANVALWGIGQ